MSSVLVADENFYPDSCTYAQPALLAENCYTSFTWLHSTFDASYGTENQILRIQEEMGETEVKRKAQLHKFFSET